MNKNIKNILRINKIKNNNGLNFFTFNIYKIKNFYFYDVSNFVNCPMDSGMGPLN